MTVIKNDKTLYVDVDETLVSMNDVRPDSPQVLINNENNTIYAWVHVNNKNIEHMLKHKARGHSIIVWSAGGWEWAEAVVRSLGLEVDLIIAKPAWYMDDLKSQEFLPEINRIYFKESV